MTQDSPPPAARSRPAWQRAVPPLLAGLLVGGLGWLLLRPAGGKVGEVGSDLVGKAAPDFTLTSLDGQTVQLSAYRGRPVVLNFWASWCGPCREEAPLFAKLAQQPNGPVIVGILFNETKENSARDFIREYHLTYPNLKDVGVDTAIAYNVTGIPHTVFIDKGGVVQHLDRGGLDTARLNAGLAKIGVPGL